MQVLLAGLGPGSNPATIPSFTGVGFQANELATLDGKLNGQEDSTSSDFQAYINWGDANQWFQAVVAPNNSGSGYEFQVKGDHIYNSAGVYNVVVYAVGPDGTSLTAYTSQVQVSPLPDSIVGTNPSIATSPKKPSNVQVSLGGLGPGANPASFSVNAGFAFPATAVASLGGDYNGSLDSTPADFQAFINWGDVSPSQWTAGTFSLNPNASSAGLDEFLVNGSHIYTTAGTYEVVVYAVGPDGTSTAERTATVTVTANPPKAVAAGSGGGQSATVNTAFANSLVATVTDASGNPLPNVPVAFTDPSGGPGVAFTGNNTITTNAQGQAVFPVTANAFAGSYTVTATVTGVTGSASFMLTNTPGQIQGSPQGYSPSQIQQAYGFDSETFANGTTPVIANGAGQTIAIVVAFQQPNILADLQAFSTAYGLPLFNQPGGPPRLPWCPSGGGSIPIAPLGDWGLEASLDVEWAHALAPGANLVLVEAPSAGTDLFTAVDTARQLPACVSDFHELGLSRIQHRDLLRPVFHDARRPHWRNFHRRHRRFWGARRISSLFTECVGRGRHGV